MTPDLPRAQAGAPADLADHIDREVSLGLAARLLREGGTAELAHLVLAVLVGWLVWDSIPHALLAGWGGALAAAVLLRGWLRRRLARSGAPPWEVRRATRGSVAAAALAWGVGVAMVGPQVSFAEFMLLVVVLSGTIAGATATLAADSSSFRIYLGIITGSLIVGVLQTGTDRPHLIAIALVTLFCVLMTRLQASAHRTMADMLRANALLAWNEAVADTDRWHLDALFAGAPVAIAVVNPEENVQRVNPQFESLFGYSAAEALGRNINDLIVPRSELPKATRLYQRASRGELVVAEVERRRKDGRLVPVRMSASLIRGAAAGSIFGMYEDITDRRRAQEAITQLASIVASSEDAIIGLRLDGTISSWNAAAERMFGYSALEAKGKSFAMLVPARLGSEHGTLLDRIRRGEHVEHFETTRVRKDGAEVPVSVSMAVTQDSGHQVTGFSTIVRNVTVEAEARKALAEAKDAAERAARTRSAFLANMSHEIRTPLNAVLGLTELLLDSELAAEQRRSVELVRQAGEGLLEILNDVLDFSKIEADHLTLETTPFDLSSLVESTARLMSVRARERHIELLCDIGPGVPHQVRGDPTRLRQVLTNLIGNAVKFTPKGEVVVTVRRDQPDDVPALVRFAVRDTGVGIPRDKLDAIFQEFEQVDASTTRKYGGTGLGLAIARRLVRLMGGELTVESDMGRGSEFRFAVPLAVDAAPPAAAAGVAPLSPSARLDGGRVLVVDDNATNRRIVRDILTVMGAHVDEAEAAERGLAGLREAATAGRPYALAVIDAQMPDQDGFGLAAQVQSERALRETRLLMLTSVGQRGDAQRCRDLGIRGYLTKPIARADFLEAVHTVLGAAAPEAGGPALVTRHLIDETRRRIKILVAEDNPVNQMVATTMLQRRGHTVHVVSDGQAAVDAVAGADYDVVLMDVQMPVLDGFAATAKIRATPKGRTLPIVAMTAHALAGERDRCLAAGMSGYLSKPFQAHELFAVAEGWASSPVAGPAPAGGTTSTVDLDALREDLEGAGAGAALPGIIETFLVSAPKQLEALQAACRSGEAVDIERAMHAYKSAASTMRARALAAVLQDGEAAAKQGEAESAAALLPRVEAEHEAVIKVLKRARKRSA